MNELIQTLKTRFLSHMHRHPDLEWEVVSSRLKQSPSNLQVLLRMEQTGGEPDVVSGNSATGELIFYDCSAQSPVGRRSLCYDRKALDGRKENKPVGCVLETAGAIGVDLLTEQEYRFLQTLGQFDQKTSSWIQTPASVRALGGALFCDYRYGQTFVYHNGAESYYGARGFRGSLKI